MNINFTNEQLQILNMAIIELPFKIAAPLVDYINSEIKRNHDEDDAALQAEKKRNK